MGNGIVAGWNAWKENDLNRRQPGKRGSKDWGPPATPRFHSMAKNFVGTRFRASCNEYMDSPDTAELLRRFVRDGCQKAFAALVERYTPVVYGAARRRTGRHDLAADVTQMVFTDLARRAPAMAWDDRLGTWLHRRAVFAAADALKSESRRHARETEASRQMQDPSLSSPSPADMERLLDAALDHLSAADRYALTLRYLEVRDLRSVGRALGISDDAAQKRIARALDRLRTVFSQRGVHLTVMAVAAGLTAEAQAHVPAGLVKSLSAGALHAGASGGLWFKAWPHLRAALVGSAGVFAIAATPLWTQHRELALRSPAAAPRTAGRETAVAPALKPVVMPRPVDMPRMETGLDLAEIVRRVAVLAKLKQTSLVYSRGRELLDSIPPKDALQALTLLHEAFPGGFPNLEWIDTGLRNCVSNAAQQDQPAALAWAKSYLTGDTRVSCLCTALRSKGDLSLDDIMPWLPLILVKHSKGQAEADVTALLEGCTRKLPFAEAAQSLVRLATQFDSTVPLKAAEELIAGDPVPVARKWGEYWTVLEQLPSPSLRNAMRTQMLKKWAADDLAAARACVESLPPEATAMYAFDAAFPHEQGQTIGQPRHQPEDWTPHLDWLSRIAPDAVPRGAGELYRHSGEQLLAWLRSHPDQVTPVFRNLMPSIICVGMPEDEAARAVEMQRLDERVRPFVQLWKNTDPAALQKCIEQTGTITHRQALERCAQP